MHIPLFTACLAKGTETLRSSLPHLHSNLTIHDCPITSDL